MPILTRSLLLGLATGGRSTIGLAALAATADRSSGSALAGRWAARAAALATAGELVGDKLPQTPSRLRPEGLTARLVLGGVGALVLARRQHSALPTTAGAAAIGVLGALAGARLGARCRAVASAKFGPDLPTALAEDAICLAAAGWATRR